MPKLQSSSYMSLGQLCNDNCKIILNKKDMKIYKEKKLIMKGIRNKSDSLWNMPIQSNTIQDNYIIFLCVASLMKL